MNEAVLKRLSLPQHADKLGREFSMIFHSLYNGWGSCLVRYKEFRELFGDSDRVKLLNAIGSGLFWDVQQLSWSDLMLHLTRLTDPPSSGKEKNLTIRRLPDLCEDRYLRDEVCGLVDKAVRAAEFARDWRNRRISHSDLELAIDPSAKPLATADLTKVKATLDAVHAVLNTISVRLLGTGIHNDVVVTPRARAFAAYLKQLADSVQYIDSVIDPSGNLPVTDLAPATTFLQRLDRRPTWQHQRAVVELREAARRFK